MPNARALIDQIVEEQEHATVKVELTGTPQSIQRGLKYLAKSKQGLKKAVKDDGSVKVSAPEKSGGDDDSPAKDDDKDDKFDDKE